METVDKVAWGEFVDNYLEFQQGEHATLIGPTGRGKTTLALELIERLPYIAVMACKPRDPMLRACGDRGYLITQSWPPPEPRSVFNRVVFWPKSEKMSDLEGQKKAFKDALVNIYESHGWCVYLDEARYITGFLGLEQIVETLWLQGRSLGISVVVSTQRPFWIPLSAYDQATHLFLWKDSDSRNVKRLCDMAPVDGKELEQVLASLGDHEFIYINTRNDLWLVSEVDKERVAA